MPELFARARGGAVVWARALNIFGRGEGGGPFRDRLPAMAGVAQALKVGRIEEQSFVALMRFDVVDILRSGTDPVPGALPAEWFRYELLSAKHPPAFGIIQVMICGRFAPLRLYRAPDLFGGCLMLRAISAAADQLRAPCPAARFKR